MASELRLAWERTYHTAIAGMSLSPGLSDVTSVHTFACKLANLATGRAPNDLPPVLPPEPDGAVVR